MEKLDLSIKALILLIVLSSCGTEQEDTDTETVVVSPSEQFSEIVEQHCYQCHDADAAEEDHGGFQSITSVFLMIQGGYIVPEDADNSPFYQRIIATDSTIMPPSSASTLSAEEIETIRDYINTLEPIEE